jgi:SanA protein
MKKRFRPLRLTGLILLPVIFLAVASNLIIHRFSKDKLYSSVEQVPENHCGLLLGTSKYTVSGGLNPYFQSRIKAAAQLYHAGKIRYLIISGDNRFKSYNEPRFMRKALLNEGIPDSVIYSDYAGFRTFDSVIRAREIFGQKRLTIISQAFHNMRAVFIAHHFGIQAIGFNAGDYTLGSDYKTMIREVFARARVFLDLYVLKTKPYFLGEKIKIPET